MPERKPRSPVFSILFMLTLAAIAFGVYLTFSTFHRNMAAQRKEASAKNLAGISTALNSYASKHDAHFPERVSQLTREFLPDESILIHAAWPDRPGYIFIPGSRPDDDKDRTLLVFENVPERKRKLGIQVLWLSGKIETLSEANLVVQITAQESAWKHTQRIWLPEAMISK